MNFISVDSICVDCCSRRPIMSHCIWKTSIYLTSTMFCSLRTQSKSLEGVWSEGRYWPTSRWSALMRSGTSLECCSGPCKHTIVAVTADGLDPGRKIKENDRGERSARESPNRCKLTSFGASMAPTTCSLCCSSHSSGPNSACTQTLC